MEFNSFEPKSKQNRAYFLFMGENHHLVSYKKGKGIVFMKGSLHRKYSFYKPRSYYIQCQN